LNCCVVDKDVYLSKLLGGLAHTVRRTRIKKVAAEGRNSTVRISQLYLDGNVSERHLIARNEQQVGSMRGQLLGTQPTQAPACPRDDG
jgi:hypothetical protein